MKRRSSLFLLGIVLTAAGCTQVDSGHLGIETKWGEIQTEPMPEGIHFHSPFGTEIHNISLRVQKMEASASASSKDLQVVATNIALNYRLDGKHIVGVYRDLGTLDMVSSTIIEPALQESVKQATALYTAEELITKRQVVKDAIAEGIRLTLEKSHILVTELSITDFKFDQKYQNAVEAKQVAEQKALTAKNDLARIKVEAEQVLARAEGEGKARMVRAEAEAKSQEMLRRTITPEIVQLRAIQKWDGHQPTVMGQGGTILDLGKMK